MQRDFRKFSGLIKYEKYWTNTSRSAKPNLNMMSEVDLNYPSKYKFYFRAKFDNAWTGQQDEAILSAFSDDFISPGDEGKSETSQSSI